MLKALFNLLGSGKREKMTELLKQGAVIVDVRSPQEFQGGHVSGAKNYPLDSLDKYLAQLKQTGKPIIFCCASGMRSGIATSKAKSEGLDAHNGGGWTSVNRMVAELR